MSTVESEPVEIADRLYWVGSYLDDDEFQCHSYLLDAGDESVLFDPGSKLTIDETLRKVERIIPFEKIRYFVCHHQDPDIVGAMPLLDEKIERSDAALVSHWRASALLKHLGLRMPFWLIEQHDWTLEVEGRRLEFHLTPYLHFPGAFVTFDPATGTLLSSDLFGGFSDEPGLFAENESFFAGVRSFHEHYMPGRDALLHSLLRLEKLGVQRIAPQHGKIIREPFVEFAFRELKQLECGLYLHAELETDVRRLLDLNDAVRAMVDGMAGERDFSGLCRHLATQAARVLPLRELHFLATDGDGLVEFAPATHFRGVRRAEPHWLSASAGESVDEWRQRHRGLHHVCDEHNPRRVEVPLFSVDDRRIAGVAAFELTRDADVSADLDHAFEALAPPLGVALERELVVRRISRERDEIYERSVRDPLTGLYTRRYLNEVVRRLVSRHDRTESAGFATIVFDIDHFKQVNDRHGHLVGDAVLRGFADLLRSCTRGEDIAVRFGGEEFVVVAGHTDGRGATILADRLRMLLAGVEFASEKEAFRVTCSAGIALHRQGETFERLLARADQELYAAKESGRNRTCVAWHD